MHEVFLHGLLATLRGVTAEESADIATLLYRHDFRLFEVTVQSPEAFTSIQRMRERLPPDCLIGAGMIFDEAQIEQARQVGAGMILSPHCDPLLIQASKQAGLASIAGAATPTEALRAVTAGTDALKYFPAEQLGPASLKLWRSILPRHLPLLPCGGITTAHLEPYLKAGAAGFGLDHALYTPGMPLDELERRAEAFQQAWRHAHGRE